MFLLLFFILLTFDFSYYLETDIGQTKISRMRADWVDILFWTNVCVCVWKNFNLILVRGRGGERLIHCSAHLCIYWLILVCAPIRNRNGNLGVLGWCSNQVTRTGLFLCTYFWRGLELVKIKPLLSASLMSYELHLNAKSTLTSFWLQALAMRVRSFPAGRYPLWTCLSTSALHFANQSNLTVAGTTICGDSSHNAHKSRARWICEPRSIYPVCPVPLISWLIKIPGGGQNSFTMRRVKQELTQ